MKKTIGIIGGMGPLATADLFKKIITNTSASCDSEHCHVIIDNIPTIPNRGDAILGAAPSPLPALTESALRLKQAGADFFIMPCNTAHYWFNELCTAAGMPGVSIVESTAAYLKSKGVYKIGLLATTGTVRGNVYTNVFGKFGIDVITPDESGQAEVMRLIYDCVKADKSPGSLKILRNTLQTMRQEGAMEYVLGCTELPILFHDCLPEYSVVDATNILARAAVSEAGYAVKYQG